MFNPFKTDQRLKDLQSEVDCLRDLLQKHATTMAHELYKLKNPQIRRSESTLDIPLTEEQENIVREFFENNKLPEQIRRGFASGGYVGLRAAMGRFGEAPSEQTRSSDAVRAIQPGTVMVNIDIDQKPFAHLDDYPGNCYKHPHLAIPPRGECTGFRDPQPPPHREPSMGDLIREEQRVMDLEAWDNLDLDDIPSPKE